mmetsp:Transcript_44148/g.71882  ORF Transcript_44148/g.71882 Transcript_44148/m.71882 type:complete len:95 (-) Transcript_44148:356-640(-)
MFHEDIQDQFTGVTERFRWHVKLTVLSLLMEGNVSAYVNCMEGTEEISHACHQGRCVRPGHFSAEDFRTNRITRNKCWNQGWCTMQHLGIRCYF